MTDYRLHSVSIESGDAVLRIFVGKSDRLVSIPLQLIQVVRLNEECAETIRRLIGNPR